MFLNSPNNFLIGQALTYYISNNTIFRDISFSLQGGQALVLHGPNGSGKSTLLRALAGFVKATDSGTLLCNDNSIFRNNVYLEFYRTRIHYLNEKIALKKTLTVKENLMFWQETLNSNSEALQYALKYFNLLEFLNLPVSCLSLGQIKRVVLARLLFSNAPLWLLDEPTIGLDEQNLLLLQKAIYNHQIDGGCTVIASHMNLNIFKATSL